MPPHRLYSDQVTPEEAAMGFQRAYVSNLDHMYYGHGSIIPAVVLPLGPGDRLTKLNNRKPQGGLRDNSRLLPRPGSWQLS